jgi:AcrR family transcriptional regulator
LSVEAIARAAEHIVDTDGMSALTMRRLGRQLGVEAMSIYHHVPNRAALERILVERLLEPAMGVDAGSPTELLDRYCRALQQAMRRRPGLAPLAATRLPSALFDAPASTAARTRLVEFGFDPAASAWILDAFLAFVVGHVLVELSEDRHVDDADAAFETGLRLLQIGLRAELGE